MLGKFALLFFLRAGALEKNNVLIKKAQNMKEIVNEILKEEESARRVIEKTKIEAGGIITDAENQAKAYLEKAQAELKHFLSQKEETAEKQFLAEKEKLLKETEEENTRLRKSWEKDIPAIARNLFSQLISKPR